MSSKKVRAITQRNPVSKKEKKNHKNVSCEQQNDSVCNNACHKEGRLQEATETETEGGNWKN